MQRLPLALRIMRRRTRGGPPAGYDVVRDPAIEVPGGDGTLLRTDHYAPVTDEPCPTILIRCPYGRGFPWNLLYGVRLAEQGFHVVLQSTRGTGGSTGEFDMWLHERDDGQMAVEWLRKQEWFSGDLATVGPSYMGYVQWMLALDPPPEWRSAVLQVPVHNPYGGFWGRGAFGLEMALVGGLAMFTQSQGALGFLRASLRLARRLSYVTRAVPLIETYRKAFDGRRPQFEGWLTHPDAGDPFWAEGDVGAVADTLEVPVSLTTGWHDLCLDQTLEQYERLCRAGRPPRLLIGPWTHTSALEEGWSELFGEALRHLRGEPPASPVRVHFGGVDEWRDLPAWPPAARTDRWHPGDGTLTREPGTGSTTFTYDPADPTPSIGGQMQSRTAGAVDNRKLESRPDVLTFTSEPLTEPLEIAGPVDAEMEVTTTAASADVFVRLCDVDPGGRSVNLCDGLARFTGTGTVAVAMGATAHRFRPGHRIRLQVSGGAHPRFARNYGTGEPLATATRLVSGQTTVGHRSILHLPVVSSAR
jgi:putative CocE/NonD family hydrolase